MPEGSQFHTEGTAMLKPQEAKQSFCGPAEPTTDCCWKSIANVQGCIK